MVEGRVHTHGTLSAVRQRSKRAAGFRGSYQVRQAGPRLRRGRPADRTARVWRRAPLLGPPPWPPMVWNVRCKKTYRATQRTNRTSADGVGQPAIGAQLDTGSTK